MLTTKQTLLVPPAPSDLPQDLGDGLVLRWARLDDADALAQFNGQVHGEGRFSQIVAAYTHDILSPDHPGVGPANVILVEDLRREGNRIVSSMCLISQTWTYAGLPFEVGRPEAVGTDPAYRRRGLVRRQFEAIHARSAALGHQVQGITGIPWYYRQFGYEYALDLGGGRLVHLERIPPLPEGEAEPYRLRRLTPDDLPFAIPLYERQARRSLIACRRPEALWRYLLAEHTPGSFLNQPYFIIETAEGQAAGYVSPSIEIWNDMSPVVELALAEGCSYRAILPALMRHLRQTGEAEAARQEKQLKSLYFNFGREHPAFEAAPDLMPVVRPPYAWYLRVADLPAFLRHIAPVLEARLAASPLAGHTGELRIHEYIRGLRLDWQKGRLAAVEPWQRQDDSEGGASFPPLVFLQLVFGYRSLAELQRAFPDCRVEGEAEALLNALFPARFSCVLAVS